ncbi:hypothetical protein HDU77_004644 [Chytriomyces hyalinus]|nr:hypothetical protein HDU77_004644 [Chytriomyces hyalinus]
MAAPSIDQFKFHCTLDLESTRWFYARLFCLFARLMFGKLNGTGLSKTLSRLFYVQLMVMSLLLVGVIMCLILETARLSVQSVFLLPLQYMLSATFKSSFLFYGEAEDSNRPNASQQIIAEIWQLASWIGVLRHVDDTEPVSQWFLHISYRGVAANLVCMATFVMYLWRFVTMDGLVKSPVQEYMLDDVQYLLFTAAFVLLIALKLSLYHERPQDADESKPRSLR